MTTAALLAGGAGSRLGGHKPLAELGGRPLMLYPLDALMLVAERVAVVCKTDTRLAPLPPGVERWNEPGQPRHPLTGILHALERAGEPLLVCAADMPGITAESCRELLVAAAEGTRAAVATAGGALAPTFAVYRMEALTILRAAPPDAPLRRTVEQLDPVRVPMPATVVRSINTPEDLAAAAEHLNPR